MNPLYGGSRAGGGHRAVLQVPGVLGALEVHLMAAVLLAGSRGVQRLQLIEKLFVALVYSDVNELLHESRHLRLQEWLQLLDQGLFIQPVVAQTGNNFGLQHSHIPPGSPVHLVHPGPQWTEDL